MLAPRAQNPYGSRLSAARRAELLAVLAKAPEVLVVEDDYSADICPGPPHSLTSAGADGPARWAQIRWWAAAGACFRIAPGPGVRITTAGLDLPEGPRLAADFAAVAAERQSTYGG